MNDLPVISPVDYFQDRSIEEVLLAGALLKPRRKIAGAFLYEDTTTLLFSRTNYGKSILAFQFAYAAATGTDLDRCDALCNDCEPMKVLVIHPPHDLRLEEVETGSIAPTSYGFASRPAASAGPICITTTTAVLARSVSRNR